MTKPPKQPRKPTDCPPGMVPVEVALLPEVLAMPAHPDTLAAARRHGLTEAQIARLYGGKGPAP